MPFRKTTTLRASLAQQAMGFPFYSPRIAGKCFFGGSIWVDRIRFDKQGCHGQTSRMTS
jgi:hypothetical protein